MGRAVEGDEDEGRGKECAGEVESRSEARRANEESEEECARTGAGVEGDVPQGAAEAALVLGDAVHGEQQGRALEHSEAGAEEKSTAEHEGSALWERGHAAGGGD